MRMKLVSLALASVAALAACSGDGSSGETSQDVTLTQEVTLASVVADPRRTEDQARDLYRHPAKTLAFFEVNADKAIAEIWPGWYTEILAPYVASGSGSYTAILLPNGLSGRADRRNAAFKAAYGDTSIYGEIQYGAFYKETADMAPTESLDVVLTFRNVHNWMHGEYEEHAFKTFYKALKPGGILGIVEHRLPESSTQSPKAETGYVQESYMKALAADAGFEFVGASEINANRKDTADHPFGVWSLPPRSRIPEDDDPEKDGFEAETYNAIGESDRATLKFRKPL